jgi:hypothetical protein
MVKGAGVGRKRIVVLRSEWLAASCTSRKGIGRARPPGLFQPAPEQLELGRAPLPGDDLLRRGPGVRPPLRLTDCRRLHRVPSDVPHLGPSRLDAQRHSPVDTASRPVTL